jgi:hypothetical protein
MSTPARLLQDDGPAPHTGAAVALCLPGGEEIVTTVVEAMGRALWLNLPPVVRPGTRIDLVWPGDGCAYRAHATTRLPSKERLSVVVGPAAKVDRRVLRRTVPSRALRTHLGLVKDISLGGIAIWLERGTTVKPGDTVTFELLSEQGEVIAHKLTARVLRVATDEDGRRFASASFPSIGLSAVTVAKLL